MSNNWTETAENAVLAFKSMEERGMSLKGLEISKILDIVEENTDLKKEKSLLFSLIHSRKKDSKREYSSYISVLAGDLQKMEIK